MHIQVTFSAGSLFGRRDTVEANIDVETSVTMFAETLEKSLRLVYPGAEIEVVHSSHDATTIDGCQSHEELPRVWEIDRKVWRGYTWIRYYK